MGNTLTNEEHYEREGTIRKMFSSNKFNKLDITGRCGHTGYLDFIKSTELGINDVMMGVDDNRRKFVVFKAEIELNNGKLISTYTTFFQRYTDDDLNWRTCGHHGKILFYTSYGVHTDQIKMLHQLLDTGVFDLSNLSDEDFDKLDLNWRSTKDCNKNTDEIKHGKKPKEIRIGHSTITKRMLRKLKMFD
jgi:hypothetical protein